MQNAIHALGIIGAILLRITLKVADSYLDFILRIRSGERAVPPTRRTRFSAELRQRIRQRQGGRCMYCGLTLNRTNLHIDHIFPVEHGGSNAEDNLQALCGSCDLRKGVQTDSEFCERYRALLSSQRTGAPPVQRIPQSAFRAETTNTSRLESTRSRQAAVFKTPRQKIMSSSGIAGIVAGGVWLFAIAIAFDGAAGVAFWGGVVVGLWVAVGLIWRAKFTGRFDQ